MNYELMSSSDSDSKEYICQNNFQVIQYNDKNVFNQYSSEHKQKNIFTLY